jgi:hypothetical protein
LQSSIQIQGKSSEIGIDVKKQEDSQSVINKSNGATSKNSVPRRGMFTNNKDSTVKTGSAGAKPKPKV